jgi:hypothetical protein
MTSTHSGAYRGLFLVFLGGTLFTSAPVQADPGFGVGWSNAPRWRIPAERPPACPRGYSGTLVQVRKARCAEAGPEGQPPRAAERPPPRPSPAPPAIGSPAAPTPPRREPPPERPPSRRPIPDLSPTPDATALMQMGPARCHDYLREREVSFVALDSREAPEVAIPVRLRGPVAGVTFTIPWSDDQDRDHHAIWDCRLVAAIVPIAEWLFARGVTEVQYFSALRRGKIVRDKPTSQHNIGLALDLYALRRGGEVATVEDHYPRRVLRRCPDPGAGATAPAAPFADLYLALVCLADGRGLVHTLLTPDHDRAHHNHLHLDLKPGQTAPADPYTSFHGL